MSGELGVGKTTLARGIASGLGASSDQVSSPTFTLIQEYPGRILMVHIDLYRLTSASELVTTGVQEYFGQDHVIFVEWADRFPQVLPEDHCIISLAHHDETVRNLTLQGTGPKSWKMVQALVQAGQNFFLF